MDPAGFPLWEVWPASGREVGRRCFASKGGRKDCFGKGELPDGTQILALEDVEWGQAGGKAIALGGGSREKMESPTCFGNRLWCCGNHGVVDGRVDGKSFLCLCVRCWGLEDGRGSHPPITHGSSGYSFSHVGGCGGGCGGGALG